MKKHFYFKIADCFSKFYRLFEEFCRWCCANSFMDFCIFQKHKSRYSGIYASEMFHVKHLFHRWNKSNHSRTKFAKILLSIYF